MALHNEVEFENEICDYLAANRWLYDGTDASQPESNKYNRQLALFPADVVAWVKETQPDAWQVLTKNHGEAAYQTLLSRLRDSLDQSGTLHVLRNGFDVLGVRSTVRMAQFKPASSINSDILKRYDANRLRVVRQVHYSVHNELNIDLVLFLNGLPVATVELKTDFTQSIDDAVDQYRFDRIPNPKGRSPEPLLTFPSGALVHFAVSSSQVYMTTRLAGPATYFLPFNQGSNGPGMSGAAGNPANPAGHKTAYLWEQVWQPDSWLDILGRYLIAEKDDKQKINAIIFPRFHQLDVTRKLVDSVRTEGAGQKYLVQHSAGSGKTKSIAWTAHFFADLHIPSHGEPQGASRGSGGGDSDEPAASALPLTEEQKVFDSVIVVSDRNVIDGQLSEAIEDMQRTKGVVANVKGTGGSKSAELSDALAAGKKVIVCTIQTFPFALEAARQLSATDGKRFAVIADEAHSSQTGVAAAKLKEVLTEEERQEVADGGEVGTEDILAIQMAGKASDDGVTYVAFTATPKAKTLETFGRLPDPSKPKDKDNLPEPFHIYSMQQAIDEEFILDVLENYTSYKLAFRLANDGKEWDEKEVEHGEAMKGLMRWVRLHPYNIAQKVQIVVEHYREMVAHLLDGKAKAMVVTGSRKEAVRWQLAINKYIADQGYEIQSLVAFSGEVNDKESGSDPFKETSQELNPDIKSTDFREEFKKPRYNILLVANKFQTGFDQPLLCAMYVDKKLAGIQAVQTLSRLNRCYKKGGIRKDTTYVLDFVNDSKDVLEAFKTYYTTATLEDVTDPTIVLDLRTKLDATGYYDEPEIERVVAIEVDPNAKQEQLEPAVEPVADRLLKRFTAAKTEYKEAEANRLDAVSRKDEEGAKTYEKEVKDAKDKMNALLLFKTDIATYQRVYTFLSQIFDYGNTDFEKRYIFFKYLIRLLKFGREREGVDLSEVILTHHNLRNKGRQQMKLASEAYPELSPLTEVGAGEVREEKKAYLTEIIEKLNEAFGKDTTDDDQLSFARTLAAKTLESTKLQMQAASNTKEQFCNSPDLTSEITDAIIDSMDVQTELSSRALNSDEIRAALTDILIERLGLYEALRERHGGSKA